jgi:hypothetical protein
MFSVLAGHKRYSHVTAIRCDGVDPGLLGMNKVISEDVMRGAFKRIREAEGNVWLDRQLSGSVAPAARRCLDSGHLTPRQAALRQTGRYHHLLQSEETGPPQQLITPSRGGSASGAGRLSPPRQRACGQAYPTGAAEDPRRPARRTQAGTGSRRLRLRQ